MIDNKEKLITVLDAEQYGISMEMVGVCREIRKLAKLDRIQLDETTHRSGLNKHLYSYIEYCGVDVKSYIKDYLANLQPYMIQRFSSQEPNDNFICVLDHMYRISLYIKIDKSFGKEVIVSFHENNKRGIYGGAIGYLDFTGNLDVCIAIRLAFKKQGKLFIRSGAGIVADSIPENEYQECINKAKAVVDAVKLAEGGIEA